MRTPFAIVLCSWFVSLAHGAVIDVKTTGPLTTIQQGVDAAGAGDTVSVFAGVYEGTVSIPIGKVGLKLVGVGNVILDARDDSGDPLGRGLVIAADNCVVRRITVRHAAYSQALDPGFGVVASGDAITLDKVTVLHCEDLGISISGDGSIVKNCTVRDSGQGMRVTGDGVRVEKCRIERVRSHAIEVSADFVTLRKNVVRGAWNADAIEVIGDGAVVEQNDVRESDRILIRVYGTDALIRKNRCLGSHEASGILWEGKDATISDNFVTDVSTYGIDVLLVGSATVERNRVERCGSQGIRVAPEDVTTVDVRDNFVRAASQGGLYVAVHFGAIERNVVRNCGGETNGAGITIQIGGTYVDNVVRGCADDGFRITGDDVVLQDNRAIDNAVDGFDVESGAAGVTLTGNIAKQNLGEGIEINGSGASLQGNVCAKNRIDLATTAIPLAFSGNAFASGGLGTSPEIE
jgi:parallel beta-helix repeat protein